MGTHIKILAWLHIVFGLLSALLALAVIGGIAIAIPFTGSLTGSAALGITAGVLGILAGGFSLFELVAGWGLLNHKPWARILTIILGVFSLIRFPLGTLLGVYTLWVLLSKDGAAEFGAT